MTDRSERIRAFLSGAGWGNASRTVLAGDLSARRYERLTLGSGESAILMHTDPSRDASTPAFVSMTDWLRKLGLSAPDILAQVPDQGILLLEDLGDDKVTGLVGDPDRQTEIYSLAIDLLIHLRAQTPPDLACPQSHDLVEMTRLADAHYPGVNSEALSRFRVLLETVFTDLLTATPSISLRDFHADNLIWLPQRKGLARLGLLDYQDAFVTHPVYDLVSLLTDARTDVAPSFRRDMRALYAQRTGDEADRLDLAFAAVSAQRNLRILGIFTRAAEALGKPVHIDKLPRVRNYLAEALEHPVFAPVKREVLEAIPAPRGMA